GPAALRGGGTRDPPSHVAPRRSACVLTFAIRRVLLAVPVILCATIVAFVAVAASVDPLANLRTCTNCSEQAYQIIIERYELDKTIPERYVSWLGSALTGDLGEASSQGRTPVGEILPG